jgi:hypothetical protein
VRQTVGEQGRVICALRRRGFGCGATLVDSHRPQADLVFVNNGVRRMSLERSSKIA